MTKFQHPSVPFGTMHVLRLVFTITLPFLFLLLPHLITARIHPAYSQEEQCSSEYHHPDWMSGLPDYRPLQLVSIPGTHDSLARFGSTKFTLQYTYETQTMPLVAQLQAGIRAFDVRCRHVDNSCHIYHQVIYQKMTLGDVLDACQTFLGQNPSEVILLRIKDREQPTLRCNRTFEESFVEEYWKRYDGLWWKPEGLDLETNPTVTLGQVRGKVVLLQYFQAEKLYSFRYKTAGRHQSNWRQFTRATLYYKWTQIRDQLDSANASASIYYDPGPYPLLGLPFYTNWLSGAFVKPYFVASGHSDWGTDGKRHTCAKHYFGSDNVFPDFPRSREKRNSLGLSYTNIYCEGTNVMTYERLHEERYRFVGIVWADFPGCGLVEAVIGVNKNF